MILSKNAEGLFRSKCFKFFLLLLASSIYPITTYAQPFAYVASIAGSTVTVVNLANHSIVAAPYIPGGMTGIAAASNGTMVYVTAQSANQVEIFSTVTNSVIGAIGVGVTPVAVAFTPNSTLAYVANRGSNTVSVINTAANVVVATIPVGTRPTGVAVNPSGTRVLVTNNWDSILSVIDTASNTVVANIAAGYGLSNVAISPTGAYAYATNQSSNSLAVISLASNSLVGNIPVQQNPTSVALTPNGARAFVTNGNSNTVSVIDTASNTVIANIGVGANPTSVAITPDGSRAEVTNALGYSASLIDANGLYIIGTLERVGIFPSAVAIPMAIPNAGASIAPVPCNYSLSGGSQDFPFTGGSGAVGLNISPGASGCNWNATSNASWITLSSGFAGNGAGSTGFVVAANSTSASRTGNITIAGLTFTVNQAQAPAAPTPVTPPPPPPLPPTGQSSVSPNSGSGGSQIFTFTYPDNGDLEAVFMKVASQDRDTECFVIFSKSSRVFRLANGSGPEFPLLPLGSSEKRQNGQCVVEGTNSSVSSSGGVLSMVLSLSFNKSDFSGPKILYMDAVTQSGVWTSWQARGTWTVPNN